MKTIKTTKAKSTTTPKTDVKPAPAKALEVAPERKRSVKTAAIQTPVAAKTAAVQAPTAPVSPPRTTTRREITTDLIAARAYIIWEKQGRPQGHDLANWLLAERQLKEEIQSLTA
jgi:hypothetical protein